MTSCLATSSSLRGLKGSNCDLLLPGVNTLRSTPNFSIFYVNQAGTDDADAAHHAAPRHEDLAGGAGEPVAAGGRHVLHEGNRCTR